MNSQVLQSGRLVAAPSSSARKVIFSVMIVLISLLVLEAGFRAILAVRVGPNVLYYGTPFQRQTFPLKTDNHTVMQHGNAQSGYTKFFPNEVKVDHDPTTNESFRVAINSRGFRGREFDDTKAPGVTRVVTLGSSSTFGYYDRDHETYPYYLEQRLNEGAGPQGKVEVLNLGIPHLRSEEILALFYAEVLPLHPDVVTFYEGVNDAARGNPNMHEGDRKNLTQRQKQSENTPLKTAYGMVRDHLITVAFLDSIRQNMIAEPTFNSQQVEQHITGTSKHFIANVDKLYQECQQRGILFVALKQQAKSHMIKEADMKRVTYAQEVQMIQDKLTREGAIKTRELHLLTHSVLTTDLENWATSNRVSFVNVQKALDQDRDVLLSWVHLSPRGNRLIADVLAEEITRWIGSPKKNLSDSRTDEVSPT